MTWKDITLRRYIEISAIMDDLQKAGQLCIENILGNLFPDLTIEEIAAQKADWLFLLHPAKKEKTEVIDGIAYAYSTEIRVMPFMQFKAFYAALQTGELVPIVKALVRPKDGVWRDAMPDDWALDRLHVPFVLGLSTDVVRTLRRLLLRIQIYGRWIAPRMMRRSFKRSLKEIRKFISQEKSRRKKPLKKRIFGLI
ncbi:MAG: hypothetical protein MdMp024_0030 [Bacteroidales bacterium]